MSMSRAQLAGELWGNLGTLFIEAGIENEDVTGHLKEPVDHTLMTLGVSYGDLATGTVGDTNVPQAIAWAMYFGYVKLLQTVAHTGVTTSVSVGAPSVSKSENRGDYIRSLERLRDAAKAEAESLMSSGTWAFNTLDLGGMTTEAVW